MENLAQTIARLRNGTLSRDDFLAQLDRIVAAEAANAATLVHTLAAENAATPLPRDLYMLAQQRIARQVEANRNSSDEQTRVLTRRSGDLGSQFPAPAPAPAGEGSVPAERIKGVGDTLNGRFVLEECIGFGGMGTVYKALDLRKLEAADRMPYIAIKVLNVQFRGHPKSLIALQREARKAQALAHPHIVSVYDFDRDGQMVYLTMEYLAGKPLSHLLRAPDFKGMPYAEAMHIVKGMGSALAYAHERGFVHCDFKPANVILTDAGVVKVIDFGIARVFQKAEAEADATVFDPGSLGALTPAYASPEMLEHREPDPRDDIYGLACISYELLTGRHPYDRQPAHQARDAAMKPSPPATLSARQWRALKAALSLERATRTPTIARFLSELGVDRVAVRKPAPAAQGAPVARRAPVLAGIVLAAVAAAGLGYAWYSGTLAPGDLAPRVATPAPLAPAAVAAVLAGIPCSALVPTVQGHSLQVRGYLSKGVGEPRLKQLLSGLAGLGSLNVDVQLLDNDKCAAINVVGPYWVRSRQAGKAPTLHSSKQNGAFVEGDLLMVDVTSPPIASYLSVDYFVLDGQVAHLLPNQNARDNAAPPNHTATIGSLGNWAIAKPFGSELIILVATPVPLFDTIRPDIESSQDYLRALSKRLNEISARHGAEQVGVDLLQITTRARAP